jgi:hypothetical protein
MLLNEIIFLSLYKEYVMLKTKLIIGSCLAAALLVGQSACAVDGVRAEDRGEYITCDVRNSLSVRYDCCEVRSSLVAQKASIEHVQDSNWKGVLYWLAEPLRSDVYESCPAGTRPDQVRIVL